MVECSFCTSQARVVHGGIRYCLEHEPQASAQAVGDIVEAMTPPPKRPTFDQLWLTLCPGDDESGVVRISDIVAVVRISDVIQSSKLGVPDRRVLRERGVVLTVRAGEEIWAPDALYSEVKLALMAAEVTS